MGERVIRLKNTLVLTSSETVFANLHELLSGL